MELNRKGKITTGKPLDVFHLNLKSYPYCDVLVEDDVDRFPFASCRLTYDQNRSTLILGDFER